MVTNYGNNVITVIDIANRKTVKDLKIGAGRMGHIAFTGEGKFGHVSNDKDGNVYKLDMTRLAVEKKIETAGELRTPVAAPESTRQSGFEVAWSLGAGAVAAATPWLQQVVTDGKSLRNISQA